MCAGDLTFKTGVGNWNLRPHLGERSCLSCIKAMSEFIHSILAQKKVCRRFCLVRFP